MPADRTQDADRARVRLDVLVDRLADLVRDLRVEIVRLGEGEEGGSGERTGGGGGAGRGG